MQDINSAPAADPFIVAVAECVAKIPPKWASVQLETAAQEEAVDALVAHRILEARIAFELVTTGPDPITLRPRFRVCGRWEGSQQIAQAINAYVAMKGFAVAGATTREFAIRAGGYRKLRLTAQGEKEREDMRRDRETAAWSLAEGIRRHRQQPLPPPLIEYMGDAKSKGPTAPTPEPEPATQHIKPSFTRAHQSRQRALKNEAGPKDDAAPKEIYKWLKVNPEPDYPLPTFSTWSRQLRGYDEAKARSPGAI